MSEVLLGGLIRFLQSIASASPTLLVGLFIAGVMRYYLGDAMTRRLFGGNSLWSLGQSWFVGMLLPVCSIGVLPILFQLRRSGVRPGAISAFALSAPLFNPLSLLYGLTLSRPIVVVAFAFFSLIVVTVIGLIWDRFEGRPDTKEELQEEEVSQTIGIKRLWISTLTMCRELTGQTGVLMLIAVSGPTILGMILPHGAMQSSVEQLDPLSPLRMLLVAVPVYATPMLAMSQLGMMFQHANSPGAALVLLLLGTGMNLATLVWLGREFGTRSTIVWFVSLVSVVMLCAYAIDRPLIPKGVEPAGHTHAFDIYTNPFPPKTTITYLQVRERLEKSLGIAETVGLSLLAAVALLGIVARFLNWRENVGVPVSPGEPMKARGLDMVVHPAIVGGVMLVGLVVFSVVGCFAYYPHPDETLAEIQIARVEALTAVTSGNLDHALHWMEVWDDWSRRLEVGVFLRTGQVRPYQRMQGYLLRKKLELLEHELEHDPYEPAEARKVVDDLLRSHRRFQNAFSTVKQQLEL